MVHARCTLFTPPESTHLTCVNAAPASQIKRACSAVLKTFFQGSSQA